LKKISIIIPNQDHYLDLKKCLESICFSTEYYTEIIIVENNSTDSEIFKYYLTLNLCTEYSNFKYKIITWNKPFNFSKIINYGVKHSSGEYILILNNDTKLISSNNWLEKMVNALDKDKIGVVGPILLYPDNTIQHAGVNINHGYHPYHKNLKLDKNLYDYYFKVSPTETVVAITGACLMTKKELFVKVKGFDEKYPLALSDIDYCMKLRSKGYSSVLTSDVTLIHYESQTRGYEDTPEKQKRFLKESRYFHHKWLKYIQINKIKSSLDLPITNIVMTTFNRLEYVKQSIKSLIEMTSKTYPYMITCIDNGSTDGTKEYLQKLYKNKKIHTLVLIDENIGIAKSQNIGWQLFKTDLTMKYDSDVVMTKKNWIDDMIPIIMNVRQIGALGYNCEETSYAIREVGPFKIRPKGGNIGGASFMMRKDVIEKLGYWCENLGKYGEEDALKGAQIAYSGLANCYMEDEKCMIHLPDKQDDYRKFKDEERNENLKKDSNFWKILNEYKKGNIIKDIPTIIENYKDKIQILSYIK